MAASFLLPALLPCLAVAYSSLRVPFEQGATTWNAKTSSWAKLDVPTANEIMSLQVALKIDQKKVDELERIFWEVSDPDHEHYGQHLSQDEITKLLGVPEEQITRVKTFFLAQGASEVVVAPNRDSLTVTMPVSSVEEALQTKIHRFGHDHHEAELLRASEGYSLPMDIAMDVEMVGELLQFPVLRSKRLSNLVGGAGQWPNACKDSGCQGLVTPAVLAERYKVPTSNTSVSQSGNTMAVAEFQGQFFKDEDLQQFSDSCHRNVKVDKVVGGDQPIPGVESELDIEYIKAVADDIPLTVIYQAQYSLLSFANKLNAMQDPPLVVSVSYGNDEQQQSSREFMLTCNVAFMKAGARGISILFASGDQGVCGREGCGFSHVRFKPDFPAGSPYITAVGGTDFYGDNIGEEMVWNAGGGGFSDTFPIPAYQQQAVAAYKKNPEAHLPQQDFWNASGRGYPDVAALGGLKTPYCVAVRGRFSGVAGTSASSPVVAGVFARLNGLRLKAGKSPLGFLNPFIYKNPSGFQDVTKGCNGAVGKCFQAVEGWDPATGMGTPNYEALSKLVLPTELKSFVV